MITLFRGKAKGEEGTDLVAARDDDGQAEEETEYEASSTEYTPEERREIAQAENREECKGICVFFFYLVVFSTAMLLEQSSASSRLADHVRMKLDSSKLALNSVVNIESFYDYMEQGFVPTMYENSTDTNLALQMSTSFHPVDLANRMVGSVQMRQVRVAKQSDCQVNPMFSEYKIECYPPFNAGGRFTASTESSANFGPNGKFSWSTVGTGAAYTGQLASYPPNGYVQVISSNSTTALITLEELKEDEFLGAATRAVFLDFTIWSQNTGTYAVVSVIVEFGPCGSTAHSVAILVLSPKTLQPAGTKEIPELIGFILNILVLVFVFYYMYEEAKEFLGAKLRYFLDGWNVLDWINMLLILVAFIMRAMVWAEAGSANIGATELENARRDEFTNLRGIAVMAETVRFLGAMNAVLLWMKVVKYLRKVPKVKELIRKVWIALNLFVPYLFMFGLAFIGFVISYNVGFGDKIQQLSTFSSTVVYLARAYLRDVKLMPAYDITPMFGAMMILLFYVALVLVGVTIVNAIFSDAIYRGKAVGGKKRVRRGEIDPMEDEPVEEFVRDITELCVRTVETIVPRKYQGLFFKRKKIGLDNESASSATSDYDPGDMDDNPFALEDDDERDHDADSEDYEEDQEKKKKKPPTRKEVLRAIEHMSGRVLSEVSIVGIEVRSELHDVCERVAQMQMAVEELTWRTDKVKAEQQDYL